MRRAFVKALVEIRRADARVLLLTGDLGYMALEPFAGEFPGSFFNVGVAEQNLIGIATGLAEAGFIPFVYSIATFATLRPLEMIRNGPVQHQLPVRVVGMGGGFEYGPCGPSHHALEDVGAMRMLPGMRIIVPADHAQARAAILATWNLPGPTYYRLGKDDQTLTPGLDGRFELGRAQMIRDGSDVLLVAMGAVAVEAAAAAERLAGEGVSAALMVIASMSPPPLDDLAQALARHPVAITVEAHAAAGGLGSLVCEVVAERGLRCRIVRAAVRRRTVEGGSPAFLHGLHGVGREQIAAAALDAWRERRG